jgi:hypothetical protein
LHLKLRRIVGVGQPHPGHCAHRRGKGIRDENIDRLPFRKDNPLRQPNLTILNNAFQCGDRHWASSIPKTTVDCNRCSIIYNSKCFAQRSDCDGLIPAQPPKEALEKRRKDADADHCHTMKHSGYRPGRSNHRRQNSSNT